MTPHAHVIGDPIAHSKSPLIHNYWLEKLGIAGAYTKMHIAEANLADYLEQQRRERSWAGCNVTMPHKQAVLPFLDDIDPFAARLRAANTIVRQPDSSLKGYNTDVGGFLEPLDAMLKAQHLFRMARVLGTGGAARAIVAGLADHGFTIVVAGRNLDKARAMLDELAPGGEHHTVHLSHFANPTDFAFDDREGCLDLVINASPLGMTGKPPLEFDWSHAPPGSIAYDIVTSPLETTFLQGARKAGHPVIDGLAMLVGQAAIAFEKLFGVSAPRDCDNELMELLKR